MNSLIPAEPYYGDQVFEEVGLERGQLVSSEFYDCRFIRCSFVESVFRDCRFVDCVFYACDLSLLQVPNSAFASTRFEDSKLIGVNWTRADWAAARVGSPVSFLRCALSHSTFIGLGLRGVQIKDCLAVDVDFREADLSGADFSGTDLAQSIFGNTDLTQADLSRARNYHIHPGQNVLRQARFSLPEAMSLLYSMDIILVDEV
jgi:fluoroquinolone resistance protein